MAPRADVGPPRYAIDADGSVAIAWRRDDGVEVVVVGSDLETRARGTIRPVSSTGAPEVALDAGGVFIGHGERIYALEERSRELALVRAIRLPALPPREVPPLPAGVARGLTGHPARIPGLTPASRMVAVAGRVVVAMEREVATRDRRELCILSLSRALDDARADCLGAPAGGDLRIWSEPSQVAVRYGVDPVREARIDPSTGTVEARAGASAQGPREPDETAVRALAASGAYERSGARGVLGLRVIDDRGVALTLDRDTGALWIYRLDADAHIVAGSKLPIERRENEWASLHLLEERAVVVLIDERRTRACTVTGACQSLLHARAEALAVSAGELVACTAARCASWMPGRAPRAWALPASSASAPLLARCDGAWLVVRGTSTDAMTLAPLDAPTAVLRVVRPLREVQIRGAHSFGLAHDGEVIDLCMPDERSVGIAGADASVLVGADGVGVISQFAGRCGLGHEVWLARGTALAAVGVSAHDVQLDSRGRLWGLDPSRTTVLVMESGPEPLRGDTPAAAPEVVLREVDVEPDL